jgi:PAS domain S-box-containing protein
MSPPGVITLDADGIITTFNKSAERMLSLDAGKILDKHYGDLLVAEHLQLAEDIMDRVTSVRDQTLEIPLRITVNGQPRNFLVYVNALKDEQASPWVSSWCSMTSRNWKKPSAWPPGGRWPGVLPTRLKIR